MSFSSLSYYFSPVLVFMSNAHSRPSLSICLCASSLQHGHTYRSHQPHSTVQYKSCNPIFQHCVYHFKSCAASSVHRRNASHLASQVNRYIRPYVDPRSIVCLRSQCSSYGIFSSSPLILCLWVLNVICLAPRIPALLNNE